MSNFLAIATVTATLQQMIQEALDAEALIVPPTGTSGAVSNASVTVGPPQAGPAEGNGNQESAHVNLFLYSVNPNAAGRNRDLPTRDSNGTLVQRPRGAFDLYYLLSFKGDEGKLEPQRLLGITLRTLHSRPVLAREMISRIVAAARDAGNPLHSTVDFLADSDLASETELVKFSPIPLSHDELSKLWSIFTNAPYTLSIAYQASVVFIEAKDTPVSGLPVRVRGVYAVPFAAPTIDEVMAEAGRGSAVTVGSRVVVRGSQLAASTARVRIGGAEVAPNAMTETHLTFIVPPEAEAGVQPVQVLHPVEVGEPPELRPGAESNVAGVVVHPTIVGSPTITGTGANKRLVVQVSPGVTARQRSALLLSGLAGGTEGAYTIPALPRDYPGVSADPALLSFAIGDVANGTYLIRVQVDGAPSMLQSDSTTGEFIGPAVVIS
jgi:hypothetical protein